MSDSPHPDFTFEEASGDISAFRHGANGLRVLHYGDEVTPVVALMVTYHVGSRNEGAGTTGATHLLEHLMFKGTERFNRRNGNDVFSVLQEVGARVNATTWLDRTNYYEVLPRDHLELAAEIEADRMRNALVNAEDLESERVVVLNELDRGQNNPIRNLHHSVWRSAYQAHPYGHPTIGWRSDVETMTASHLRSYYDTFYWPNNATVSVIGDVSLDRALDMVARHFGQIPASSEPIPRLRTVEPRQQGQRSTTVKQAGQLGALMLAYKSPPALDYDTDALAVLARILAYGNSSRCYREVTDKGLATSVHASVTRLQFPGLFQIYGFLADGVDSEAMETALERVIDDVAEKGVTETELERAKGRIRAEEAFGRDGPFLIAAQLNESIAAGDWKLFTTYRSRIERVTAEDVSRVARDYLNRDTLTIGRYEPTRKTVS